VLRAVLHAVPHLAAAEAARDLLDRAVGHVGDPARGRELALAAQQLRDRLAEARLPDEVDGVDAVREPPGRQGARHREPGLLRDEPAVRVEEHPQRSPAAARLLERPRQVLAEDRVHVARPRAHRATAREPPLAEVDHVAAQHRHFVGAEPAPARVARVVPRGGDAAVVALGLPSSGPAAAALGVPVLHLGRREGPAAASPDAVDARRAGAHGLLDRGVAPDRHEHLLAEPRAGRPHLRQHSA
jgi:hypothetical protein